MQILRVPAVRPRQVGGILPLQRLGGVSRVVGQPGLLRLPGLVAASDQCLELRDLGFETAAGASRRAGLRILPVIALSRPGARLVCAVLGPDVAFGLLQDLGLRRGGGVLVLDPLGRGQDQAARTFRRARRLGDAARILGHETANRGQDILDLGIADRFRHARTSFLSLLRAPRAE